MPAIAKHISKKIFFSLVMKRYKKRIRDLEESAQNENTISKDSEETL